MKYQQIQTITYGLIGLTAFSVILTIASFFMSTWIAVLGGIFLLLSGSLWYWFYSIAFFKPKSQYFYIRVNGASSNDELSYILKNIGYVLAHQHSNLLFSICILNKKHALPVLIAPASFSSESLVSVLKDSKDFRKLEIHLEKIKDVPSELDGTFLYTYLNEKLMDKNTPKINLFDIFHETNEIKAVYINCIYSRQYKNLMGNLVFVSSKPKTDISTSVEIVSTRLPLIEAIDPNQGNPFNRLLSPITKTLILFQLGDAVIETAETLKFKAVENPMNARTSPLNPLSESSAEWITAMCGENFESPVKLQPRSLVLQDFPGLSNPTTIWASTFIRNQTSVILIDFEGSASTSIRALNSTEVMNDEVAIIKAPDKSPDRLINLLSIWDGIADIYYFPILGLLLRSVEDFIRYSFGDLKKEDQDRIIAILQGAILLIAVQRRPFDFASLIISINELITPAVFLSSIHKVLHTVVYDSTDVNELNLAWTIISQLGTTVDYSKTLASIDPDRNMKLNIDDLNVIKTRMTAFINDSANIILSNGESNYNLLDINSLVFDLSDWAATQRSITFTPEYVITGATFIQSLRDLLGLPETHIIVNGVSSLSPIYQTRVLNFLKVKLAKHESIGDFIISDKTPLDSYANMFNTSLLDDVYFLRINELGQFRQILSPIKGVAESIFLLKKQNGYLLRNNRQTKKISITNFFTAQPKIVLGKDRT